MVKIAFINLADATEMLYRELDLTWSDIYDVVENKRQFRLVCAVGFAESSEDIFVHCSGVVINQEKLEELEKAVKEHVERLVDASDDVDYKDIIFKAAEYLASMLNVEVDIINIYDISEYEIAYLIAIPN